MKKREILRAMTAINWTPTKIGKRIVAAEMSSEKGFNRFPTRWCRKALVDYLDGTKTIVQCDRAHLCPSH